MKVLRASCRFFRNLSRPRSSAAELKVLLVLMHRTIINSEKYLVNIIQDLTDAATKLATDVELTKQANAQALAAKDQIISDQAATIAGLNDQLAAFESDAESITAVTQVLVDADNKLTAPAEPAAT